jgi:hypothetical protein
MNTSNILVTTTSSIEGYIILKYIQTVSSHVVLGTNVFSDFTASFTDFFGGQSTIYEGKLKEIYVKELGSLKRETLNVEYCPMCLKYKYGFFVDKVNPLKAKEWLLNTINYIEKVNL